MTALTQHIAQFSQHALFQSLQAAEPVFWQNPHYAPFAQAKDDAGLTLADTQAAVERLARFAPYIQHVFPETAAAQGIIESPIYALNQVQAALGVSGKVYLKADNELPISGSIKARGGIYEVLYLAEKLALEHGILSLSDDYRVLAEQKARDVFARYTVAVGSTGNLGLSIGIMAAKLGFQTAVHMSADAKQWKKDMLRANGVTVYEYAGDYGLAVAQGRALAEKDAYSYFVDDENSRHLFLGYAVAGLRLKQQLDKVGIEISREQPLYVYLPCGVGGAPSGVAFGLKCVFGNDVYPVFAEPTHSPCMLLGVWSGLHDEISVQDIGLDNRTIADGLAVGRPSGFAGRAMQRSIRAFYTVNDSDLPPLVKLMYEKEKLRLEPSACASLLGMRHLADVPNAVHLAWATGGALVPDDVFAEYLQ